MQEFLTISADPAASITALAAAIEQAAIAHSRALQIDHDTMLSRYGLLWMLVRFRLRMQRFPKGKLQVQTFLRKPSAAFCIRDYTLLDATGPCGTAVQSWVLVDAAVRKLRSMKCVPAFDLLPTPSPERTELLRYVALPDTLPRFTQWTVAPEEIDDNGHLNNVCYIRHAEALCNQRFPCMEIAYNHECFAGETLRLQSDGRNVLGQKADGAEAFRCRFYCEGEPV